MGCSGCSKKKKNVAQQAANMLRSREESSMADKNYVLVLYTHPNRGRHGVIGASTKKKYGYRGGGDQFLVHIDDVKARPDHFRIIQRPEAVSIPTPTKAPPPPPRPTTVAEMEKMEALLVEPPHMQKVDMPPQEMAEKIIQQTKPAGYIELGALPGVTPAIESNLRKEGVVTIADFKELGVAGLVKIKFIGKARAEAIMLHIDSLETGSGITNDPEPVADPA